MINNDEHTNSNDRMNVSTNIDNSRFNSSTQKIRLVDYDTDLEDDTTIENYNLLASHLNENEEQIFNLENSTDINEDLPINDPIPIAFNETIESANKNKFLKIDNIDNRKTNVKPLGRSDLGNSTGGNNSDSVNKYENIREQDLSSRYESFIKPGVLDCDRVDNAILTQSLFKKGKQLEKCWEKLKDLEVVLERLNVEPSVPSSKCSKNKKCKEPVVENIQSIIFEDCQISVEDKSPLINRVLVPMRRDHLIVRENNQLIVDDSLLFLMIRLTL